MAASDSDIWELVKLLTPSDIQHLYAELGMSVHQVELWEDETDKNDTAQLKARKVLYRWKRGLKDQKEGSRQVFLQALSRCRLFDVCRKLEEQWEMRGNETI